MKKQVYFLEIMKQSRPGKNQPPTTRKGKIKIYPTSKARIYKVFSNYGWMVTQLAPAK